MNRSLATLFSLAVAACALFPQTLLAQDDMADDRAIVVTGQGFAPPPGDPAYATVVLDREELDRAASGRIEDVLSGVAGFQQFRRSDSRSANPSAQGAVMRGLGGNATSRSLVLLDGVPQANPFFGYIPFSALPPERLARVRVTRGGGSGAFGAGAVAGTIALESAGLADLAWLEARALINDRGETEAAGSLAAPLGGGFAVVSGRWDRGQGFFTTPEDQRVPATARAAFDGWSTSLRAVAPLGPTGEIQVRVAAFDDSRTLRFDGADSSSSGQDASVRAIGRGAWPFEAIGYVQLRDFSNVVISSSRFTRVLDQAATPSKGFGGKFELRPPLGDAHTLRAGVDARIADGTLREVAFNAFTGAVREQRRAGGRNSNYGLYAEHDWRIGRAVLTAGARFDRWIVADGFFAARDAAGAPIEDQVYPRRAGWDESVRGGALYDVGAGLSLRVAAYSGLRLPTLNELYRPFVVFPVETRANAALTNEKLRGFEGGIDWRSGTASLSLTAFDNRLKNAVTNVTIGENLRQRRNIDAIDTRGVEANGRIGFGVFALDASLAWIDAENDASGEASALDGLRPAQVPRLTGSATASLGISHETRLALTLRHETARFEDDRNTTRLPGATTLDAYGAIRLSEALSLVMRAENLFAARIVTRNSEGAFDLGTPRTVWLGLRARIGVR